MKTQLEAFRDHCRRMAEAEHKPECPTRTVVKPYWPPGGWVPADGENPMNGLAWIGPEPHWEPPKCDGCNSEADRALFARLAVEIDEYQQPTLEDA